LLKRRRPPAIFIADAPGLDFLNSIATPTDTPIDWIAMVYWTGWRRLCRENWIASQPRHEACGNGSGRSSAAMQAGH
jgi:hypothetical protein